MLGRSGGGRLSWEETRCFSGLPVRCQGPLRKGTGHDVPCQTVTGQPRGHVGFYCFLSCLAVRVIYRLAAAELQPLECLALVSRDILPLDFILPLGWDWARLRYRHCKLIRKPHVALFEPHVHIGLALEHCRSFLFAWGSFPAGSNAFLGSVTLLLSLFRPTTLAFFPSFFATTANCVGSFYSSQWQGRCFTESRPWPWWWSWLRDQSSVWLSTTPSLGAATTHEPATSRR